MGLQNAKENMFHGCGHLILWLWKTCGKVVEILLKEFA